MVEVGELEKQKGELEAALKKVFFFFFFFPPTCHIGTSKMQKNTLR